MRFRRSLGLVGVIGAAAIAAPAGASAVTLGSVATSDPGACLAGMSSAFFAQTGTAPTSPSYVVPAGGGLITGWSTSFGPAGAPVELLITHPPSGMNFTVVGVDPETFPSSGSVADFTLSHPITVQAGDILGLFYTGNSNTRCAFSSPSSSDVVSAGIASGASPGSTLTASTSFASAFTNVSATLIQSSDMAITGAATPSAVNTGDLANFAFQVTATPAGAGTLTDTLPTGLKPVAASTGTGACTITGQAISCPISEAPATVNITVQGTAPGTYTNTVQVANSITDTNPGNNTASVSLGVVNPPPTPQCTVPKLKGAPVSVAKAVLPLVNCKVGKVTKAKSKSVRKGNVISTNPKGGSKRAAGTKVAIKSSSGKTKKKH
jgi:Domain of unknown function DUF11/PASTA domain